MSRIDKLIEEFDNFGIEAVMISGLWNIRYLSGFTGSNGVLIITRNEKLLVTDYRYFEQAKQQTDFEVILHAGHTGHKGKIYEAVARQLNERNIKKMGFEERHISFGLHKWLDEMFDGELVPSYDIVENIRMIKSPDELDKIREACRITDEAYLHITNFIKVGMTELEVAGELEDFMKKENGYAAGFPPIVASGSRSSLPHGRATGKKIEKGEMITIDFGACYDGYWADISRSRIHGRTVR
ncbi:M24 family metallopeptidase [Salinicoccus sp. CNSTN-B1]